MTWYADLYSECWSRNSATVRPDDAKVEKSTERVFAVANGRMAARNTKRIVNGWRATERAGWQSRSENLGYIRHAKSVYSIQTDEFGRREAFLNENPDRSGSSFASLRAIAVVEQCGPVTGKEAGTPAVAMGNAEDLAKTRSKCVCLHMSQTAVT